MIYHWDDDTEELHVAYADRLLDLMQKHYRNYQLTHPEGKEDLQIKTMDMDVAKEYFVAMRFDEDSDVGIL